MHSPEINGEGELRGQPVNPGSPGKMAVKAVCVCVCCVLYAKRPPLAAEPNYFLHAEKPPKIGIGRKSAEIYFSSNRRKNFSLNPHYDEIIFDSPGFYIAI